MLSTAELLASIKVNGAIPENQDQFSDAVILELADEVMQQTLLPVIMATKEEYFVFEQRFPITAGQKSYRLPSRSIGGVLRDVMIECGTASRSLMQMNPEDIETTRTGQPVAFYMQSSSLILYPTPAMTDNSVLNMKYFVRPAMLTAVTNASRVSAINTATNTVTLQSMPSVFLSGSILDFTKGTAHYEPLSIGHVITSIVGSTVQLTALPTGLEVGDWISLNGYSPVPSIPEDYHGVLALLTASKILQSLGQSDQEAALIAKAEISINRLGAVLSPRVLGEPKKYRSPLF